VARDAEVAEWPDRKDRRRVDPRESYVWLRLHGQWTEGIIHKWIQRPDGVWLAWLKHRNLEGYAYPVWGLFVYSPETIRPRSDGPRPDD